MFIYNSSVIFVIRALSIIIFGLVNICDLSAKDLTKQTHKMSKQAEPATYDKGVFKSDPQYSEQKYNAQNQRDIYGKKRAVNTARPLLELGRPYLQVGAYTPGLPLRFMIYGDFQSAFGVNQVLGESQQILGLRANLELDLNLTSTERIHALIRPLDSGNQPSLIRLDGDDDDKGGLIHIYQHCLESECNALESFDEIFANLFFEGEISNLPIALGKIPHLLQNGVWLEDAYIGGVISLAAQNSKMLDISNYDITLIAGLKGVDDRVFGGVANNGNDASFMATAFFVDAWGGFLEGGYGYVHDNGADDIRTLFTGDPRFLGSEFDGDLSYHNLSVAFTKRYGATVSNSVRFIANFGQESFDVEGTSYQNANGFALLIENSLITSKPLTLVPYFNFFIGIDSPQALSRQFGLLRNTGIMFENNILTGQQSLFDNPDDSVGGALGIEYLFNLDQQIAVEAAASASICRDANGENALGNVCRRGNFNGISVKDQAGLGVRYQLPFEVIKRAWILRADAAYGQLFSDDDSEDFFSARIELRRKF
jgi:hypothetical protein